MVQVGLELETTNIGVTGLKDCAATTDIICIDTYIGFANVDLDKYIFE